MRRELANDCHTLALKVLAETLTDERRAQRFLGLTGLSPDGIRMALEDGALLAACIGFLEAHEPDLISVAGALDLDPAAIVALRPELEN
ncbi:MAG TPA: DUF3572 family protein [Sphingomicrobium sp.]|nr:DUF3572 family protein [Sphingomicrobium sp.]